MKEDIRFEFVYNDNINLGKNIISDDLSILFIPDVRTDAFCIYLYDWTVELLVRQIEEGYYAIEYVGGYFLPGRAQITRIVVPQSRRGNVYAKVNFPCLGGVYYSDYSNFMCKKYLDAENGMYAIGDLDKKGACIEFASQNYAKISKEGELLAVYLKIYGIPEIGFRDV